MIQKVSAGRTEMGAMLNRIDSSIQNLESYNENTSSGRSRILDADLAVETSDRAKLDIQRYAASAALTQSKEISTGALKLLS
jgi:flagellin